MSAVFAFAGEYATFGFVVRFVAFGECTQIYGRNGNIRFGRGFLAVAEVPQMALLCGLLGL